MGPALIRQPVSNYLTSLKYHSEEAVQFLISQTSTMFQIYRFLNVSQTHFQGLSTSHPEECSGGRCAERAMQGRQIQIVPSAFSFVIKWASPYHGQ